MIECPLCNRDMVIKDWNKDIRIGECNPCHITKYISIKENRFLKDEEIHKLAKDFE